MLGHVRKRSKTSWAVVVDLGRDPGTGKRRRLWRSVRGTKRDAQALLVQLLGERDAGFRPGRRITVAEFLERWLRDYAATNTAPKTHRTYKDLVRNHLTPGLGNAVLSTLAPDQIQRFYRQLSAKGLSPTTVLHAHRILREALQHAVKWQLLPRNPADLVDPPRAARREVLALKPEAVRGVLTAAGETEYGALVHLAVMTGLRQGELLALRWDDVDLKSRTLQVRRTLQRLDGLHFREPKTAGSRRSVALSPSTVASLRQLAEKQTKAKALAGSAYRDDGLVFATAVGTPIDPRNVNRTWYRIIKAARLQGLRFHDLRHTHASLMLAQGTHPKIVSERLGHSGVRITLDTYSHALPNLQLEAAATLDQTLLAPSKQRAPRSDPTRARKLEEST
jgi:integrase